MVDKVAAEAVISSTYSYLKLNDFKIKIFSSHKVGFQGKIEMIATLYVWRKIYE